MTNIRGAPPERPAPVWEPKCFGMTVVEGRQRALPEFPIELSASFFIGSMFEVLGWWLRQSPRPPAADLAHYLEVLILQPTMASAVEPHGRSDDQRSDERRTKAR